MIFMLKRFFTVKDEIKKTLIDLKKPYNITECNANKLEKLLEILQLLEIVTLKLDSRESDLLVSKAFLIFKKSNCQIQIIHLQTILEKKFLIE